jgi:hypothetical protein
MLKKIFIIMGLSVALSLGQKPQCFKITDPPINIILNQYENQKTKFDKKKIPSQKFIYEITNITTFPYFCLFPKMEAPKKASKVFLCDLPSSIYKYKDSSGDTHIQIGVVDYIKDNNFIYLKTYKLFFYINKKDTYVWLEERKPVKLTFMRKGDSFIPID